MKIARYGVLFDVVDDPQTAKWRFWQEHYATGKWEPGTLTAIEEHLTPESTFVDIGAWVGPTVLWASRVCAQVVAVEPDPTALDVLRANVARNCANVTVIPKAVAARAGTAAIFSQGEWGDSMSTLVARTGPTIEVDTLTLAELVDPLDNIGLVKIDIEGGEAAIAGQLTTLSCPVVLALHLPWLDNPDTLLEQLDDFDVTVLDPHPQFPTLLLR